MLRCNYEVQIIFAKHKVKPPTLSCVRSDGSVTWQTYGNQGAFFPIHDLTHFAVETELGYTRAFFGMVAAGRDLGDFGPGDAAGFHPEAMHAEILVGLLNTVEGSGGSLTYSEIVELTHGKTRELDIPPLELMERQLAAIRAHATELTARWRRLPEGETLTLTFP